jgi:hypothetical protein
VQVLSVQTALSIQSHPDKKLAEKLHAQQPKVCGVAAAAAAALSIGSTAGCFQGQETELHGSSRSSSSTACIRLWHNYRPKAALHLQTVLDSIGGLY